MYPVGTVIDQRSDGSFIYQSFKGVLNLDTSKDLSEVMKEDQSTLENIHLEETL